jgi:O-antigen/teichoic acid export membrane protein
LLRFSTQGLSLLTNIFIVRQLTVDDYGVYSIALTIVGFVVTFGFSWSSSAIVYYGSKEKAESGAINKTFWSRNIILFFSLSIISLLFVIFRSRINLYIGQEFAIIILIWVYVRVIIDYLKKYFLAVKKQILSTLITFISKLFFLILVILISLDIKTVIFLYLLSEFVVMFFVFRINKKDINRFEFDKEYFKEILSFSLWQFFGFSGLYIINFGDNFVIKHFMTTADVGIYNSSYKLFNGLAGLAFIISSYYAPLISEYFQNDAKEKLKKFFYKERWFIFIVAFILHIIIIIFSKQIVTLIYGERYLKAVSVLRILLIGSASKYFSVFYIIYCNTNKRYKELQFINIFRSILNIVLDIIFIQIFGLIGPAIATTLAILIAISIEFVLFEKNILNLCNDCTAKSLK